MPKGMTMVGSGVSPTPATINRGILGVFAPKPPIERWTELRRLEAKDRSDAELASLQAASLRGPER